MSKFTVAPFVSRTENGYLQTGYALLSNGFWMTRSSGSHIWAMSEGRALELSVKVGGKSSATPVAFVKWGVHVKAAKAAPVVVAAAAGPFANLPATPVAATAPVVAAPAAGVVQAASAAAAVAPKKPRSVAQTAATLKLTSTNALRCERGEIGGDLGKARKAVATAFASYATACKAAGVEMDGELVENARFASGFDDLGDDKAIAE
jgi:hypothetical protein